MAGLFEELKRRNVFKVGTAYIVLSWLLAQAADLASDTFGAPDWVMKMLVTMLALLFPLVLFFAWAYELTPEGLKKEKDVDRTQSITHKTGRKLDFTIIGILVIALGYFVWESRFETREKGQEPYSSDTTASNPAEQLEEGSGPIPGAADATSALDPKSIAVLPFVNMSSDPEQEYFSDGISEEILNALARVSELKVAGRTSSFAFKGENQDLQQIGKALRVANLLEGSVRKSGNKLRITAQLIKVEDGFHLWSETYDREMDDIFAIQDEISNAILEQLKAKLLGGERIASEQNAIDPQAYAQYLLAKQRIYERTQSSLELAADLLASAVKTDPEFAAAHAQLGIATMLLSENEYGTLPRDEAYTQGKKHLDTALALDPNQPEALAGMGLYENSFPGGQEKAIAWLRRSLEVDPHQSNASNWLANYLRQTGQAREALEIRERDFARDPLYMPVFSNLVGIYTANGEMEKAARVLEQLKPYLHDDANLLMTEAGYYQAVGQWAKSIQLYREAYETEPRNFVNQVNYSYSLVYMGQYESAAELAPNSLAALALTRLGRSEEGLIRGQKDAEQAQYPGFYFQALVESGQNERLVKFVEERWPELADLDRDFPERGGFGTQIMPFVAEAYKNLGNHAKFQEALSLAKASNDQQIAQGADNLYLNHSQAYLAALDDNPDEAITQLNRAIDQGLVIDLTPPKAWPALQALRGDPRYEAARKKMLEHLNAERAEMGLEPLTT